MTVAASAVALASFVVAGRAGVALHPDYSPLRAPALPLLPAIGVLLAALPAFATPPLPADAS